jgi:hypothetical protein
VITAYFDASGNLPVDPLLTVGGFVAPLDKWQLFEVLWGDELTSAGVPYYHAAELEALGGVYKRAGWAQSDKVAFQKSFISCIGAARLSWGISCGITHADFEAETALRTLVRTPYAVCALWCVLNVIDRGRKEGWSEQVQFWFDRGDNGAGELKDLLLRLREVEPLLGPIHFGNKAEFLGLQPADFHAYEAWKHLKNQYLAGRPFEMETIRKSLRAGMTACDEMECSILSLRTFETLIEEIRRLKSVKLPS